VLCICVVVLPAVASSETSPAIEAHNVGVYPEQTHSWLPPSATIAPGGAVALSNATSVPHGVKWVAGPETPACTGGVPVGTTAEASGANWSGTCRFVKPGVYQFYCTVHGPEMTGTITVDASGTTTTTTTGATETSAPGATPGSAPGSAGLGSQTTDGSIAPGSLLAGNASSAVRVAGIQHGHSVHGSVAVSGAGAGGTLAVELLARRALLASAGHPPTVPVGHMTRSSLRAGTVAFTVTLNAKARRALRAHGRLAVSVRILLTSASGAKLTVTRGVLVRG
jgi:plastocyanin